MTLKDFKRKEIVSPTDPRRTMECSDCGEPAPVDPSGVCVDCWESFWRSTS